MLNEYDELAKGVGKFYMRGSSYVIYVPAYTPRSNGIKVLYYLYDLILESGRDVRLYLSEPLLDAVLLAPLKYRQAYSTHPVANDEIVIYPETEPENPLRAKNIVRYLLNKPQYLMGTPIRYSETDYLLSYSTYIDDELPQLFILHPDLEKYTPNIDKLNTIVIYIGKTRQKPEISLDLFNYFKKSKYTFVVISRNNPKTHEEYYLKLKAAKGLISFDALSSVTLEALMCDIPVYLMDDLYQSKDRKIDISMNGLVFNDNDFIRAVSSGMRTGIFEEVMSEISKNLTKTNHALQKIEDHFKNFNFNEIGFDSPVNKWVAMRIEKDAAMFEKNLNSIPITSFSSTYLYCDRVYARRRLPKLVNKALNVMKQLIKWKKLRNTLAYVYNRYMIAVVSH